MMSKDKGLIGFKDEGLKLFSIADDDSVALSTLRSGII